MSWAPRLLLLAGMACALALAGCGGGSPASSSNNPPPSSSGSNVTAIQVNTGPTATQLGTNDYPYINGPFTSVTLCVPGTTTCQTIGGILVDTGSEGLRVLSSALTISLPQQTQGGNPVGECFPFVSGVTWGPVVTADVEMGSEKASSVPIQVIGGTGIGSSVPAPSCTDMGTPLQDLYDLGQNGVLGIGPFAQDCGTDCASSSTNLGWYYSCPSSGCQVTTEDVSQQVENPVVALPTDNNGVIVELPALTGSPPVATTVSGSLIFGIGTQSNNGLGGATIYQTDPTYGNISVAFPAVGQPNSTVYSDVGYIDSGSGALIFADPTTAGNVPYDSSTGLYTPNLALPAGLNFSATNMGYNGTSGTFDFTVENGDSLTSDYPNDAAFGDLGAPSTTVSGPSQYDFFDWGLPFFFGRNVYVAIQGQSTPGGSGPYFAY